ncbi:MAG: chromosome segregation protein SMC [Candidatus Iainarchaeum archaeon]|uniref:Chromosome segregation protein SMC n=1 Tax=Candidatus Iainarchaeum sp. TaxID=3101447 RepID=A0A7T9DJ23_9ARCH|nr:MAG: chromosome segregation protein SMC [Candidatus Diapherotrites archaeon]
MIRLTKLRMKNFKSFRNAAITFSNGFTAIAGANGSGKSNVMDAVLFALGETSLKSLRAGRLTDLVNTGSSDGYAVVNITLEEGDKAYDISRTIDKQGKSVYRLGEKRVTLNEISNLLQELGLSADGHNMVVQGDLLKIIDMNPIERRGLIDEVAGLQEFEAKKAEAMKDLDKVERKIKDITIVLNERVAVVEQLSKERQIAQRYTQLEKELRETKGTILHTEAKELNARLKKILDEQMEIIEKKEEAHAKRQVTLTQINGLEKELNELDAQLIGVKRQAFESLGKSVEEQKAEIKVSEERLLHLQRRKQELEQEKVELKALVEKANQAIVQKKSEMEKHAAELKELMEKLTPLQAKKDETLKKKMELLHHSQELEKELSTQRDALTQFREKIAGLNAKMDSARKEKEMRENMHARMQMELSRAQAEMKNLEKDLHEIEKIHKRFPNIAKEKQRLQEAFADLEKQIAEHKGMAFSHSSSIEQLHKTKANCPICERDLPKELKDSLHKQKETMHKQALAHVEKLEAQRVKLHEEMDSLRKAEGDLNHFSHSQTRSQHLKEQEKLITKELETLKKQSPASNENEWNEQRKELESQLQQAKSEVEKTEAKLLKVRDQLHQTTMDEQLANFSNQRAQLEKKHFMLQTELEIPQNAIAQSKAREKAMKEEEKTAQEQIKTEETRQKALHKALVDAEAAYQSALSANQSLVRKREQLYERVNNEREKERTWQEKGYRLESQLSELKIDQSKYDTRLVDVNEELKHYEGVKFLEGMEQVELKKRIPVLEHEIKQLGAINMRALEDFGHYEKEVLDIRDKAQVLSEERLAVLDMIKGIDVKRGEAFMETFDEINKNFNRLYTSFFDGTANLSLTNPAAPLESGLIIEAKHGSENRLKNIDSMSGGEKSMTVLAFIFAVQLYEPAPFYFFDEVDAALDMNNSVKIAMLIKEMSKASQFVMVTHNDAVVKAADQIMGVTKSNTVSTVLGLKLEKAIAEGFISSDGYNRTDGETANE